MNLLTRLKIRWNEIFHKAEIDAKLIEMNSKDGRTDAIFEFPGVALLASEIGGYFDKVGAPNWVELQFMDRVSMRVFVMTIQLKQGETPAQKIARLEKQIEQLKAAENQIKEQTA